MNLLKQMQTLVLLVAAASLLASLCGCTTLRNKVHSADSTEQSSSPAKQTGSEGLSADSSSTQAKIQTGFITEQILEGADGEIHYSYYLPEEYDENKAYPMMVVMPGYDRMWFGEDSSGANLKWSGFRAWTELDEDMIVISAQLTDWGEKSARQAVELTEYFLEHFTVDPARVYAAGYSAGGETMSRAVAMRPDLYAAYLHGASQWDGAFAPVAKNGVAVYIFMAENDEYYGSQRAWDAYNGLREAYVSAGWEDEKIAPLLQIETPDNNWFAARGIIGNYHGGGNVVFDETSILNWIISHHK